MIPHFRPAWLAEQLDDPEAIGGRHLNADDFLPREGPSWRRVAGELLVVLVVLALCFVIPAIFAGA